MNVTVKQYDDHTKGHSEMTLVQGALLIIWQLAVYLWLIRGPLRLSGSGASKRKSDPEKGEAENASLLSENENAADRTTAALGNHITGNTNNNQSLEKSAENAPKKPTPQYEALTFDQFLKAVVITGLVMCYFYFCDYKKIFPMTPRVYNRDTFLFLIFLMFFIATMVTLRPTKDNLLSRDQTEEWKGWMQVMFIWYHYFAAKEWYNWIRIYIACYVWMTGFGNFSFFWVREDYSLWRVFKMLWRLNFLVVLICGVVSNEYMLYYICPMHTYWFLTVYATMAIFPSWNKNRLRMPIKLAAYAIINFCIFDIKGVSSMVFRPLWFILQFRDDKHDIMHEWSFRCGLDHWVCFIGMLCAYNYPYYEAFMKYLERDQNKYKIGAKILITILSVVVIVKWYTTYMILDKLAYNEVHPYTSFIVILFYIVNRNMWQLLRSYHLHMFAWLGKITLETYLAQLHIYLQSNAKHLIGYIGGYPLLTFALAHIIYVPMSYALFRLTSQLSNFLIPKDYRKTAKLAVIGVCVFGISLMGSALFSQLRTFKL